MFLDGPRTAHEAGKALGKPTGSIFGVLRRMHAEGLLIADEPPTRGTQYRLSDEARIALLEQAEDDGDIGVLAAGQRLLFVERPARRASALEVLAAESLTAPVAWVAETDGGWLLALTPDLEDAYPVDRLALAFERADVAVTEMYVAGLRNGRALRNRAAWLLEEQGERTTDREPRP